MKKNCPVCLNKKNQIIYQRGNFQIIQCRQCGFAWLIPYLDQKEVNKIYQKDYFKEKGESFYFADAKKKYDSIKKYIVDKKNILDYGCGLGQFIYYLKKNNYTPFGYDLSSYAAAYARKKYQVKAISVPLRKDIYKKNFFDAITCFDVLEHALDFKKIIEYFSFWLKSGGFLFITTPNIDSFERKLLGRFWYGFTKIPEHINYFSPKSIKLILERNNLRIIKIQNFGFVRSIGFYLEKIKPLRKLSRLSFLQKINFYLPLTDMLVIAKKVG